MLKEKYKQEKEEHGWKCQTYTKQMSFGQLVDMLLLLAYDVSLCVFNKLEEFEGVMYCDWEFFNGYDANRLKIYQADCLYMKRQYVEMNAGYIMEHHTRLKTKMEQDLRRQYKMMVNSEANKTTNQPEDQP